MRLLKTAAAYTRPPMSWVKGRSTDWTEKDYLLTLAYEEYLEGMHSCGYPRHICQHPDNAGGWFTTDTVTCYAAEAVELVTKSDHYKPEPGQALIVAYERDEARNPLPPPGA